MEGNEQEKAEKKKLIREMQEKDEENVSELPEQPETLDQADGTYTIEVVLEGGTGRSYIDSPAEIIVKDGVASAKIRWSSEHYDYMIVNEEKFLPINVDGNSTFEIPVYLYDRGMPVIADTTAMSVPHEITYTLTFKRDSLKRINSTNSNSFTIVGLLILGIISIGIVLSRRFHKK